jgi:DNA-binding CsgD family transcriptional regulator
VLHAATSDWAIDDLEPAERAQLIAVDVAAQSLVFSHPSIRVAVLENSTSGERTQVHLLLARLSANLPMKKAWHLAEATVGPDEPVAALLVETAYVAVRSGDPVGAVAMLIRSAQLGSDGENRARRLSAAAHIGATAAGQLPQASSLLDDARRARGDGRESLMASVTSAYLQINNDGDVDTAHRVVVDALSRHDGASSGRDEGIGAAINALGYLGRLSARMELAESVDRAIERLAPDIRGDLQLLTDIASDPARATIHSLAELDVKIVELPDDADVDRVLKISRAAVSVDRLAGCREALCRVVREGEKRNAVGQTIMALELLSWDRVRCGAWDRAIDLAEEGLSLGQVNGNSLYAWSFQEIRGFVAAARGEESFVDQSALEIARWGMPRRAAATRAAVRHVQGLAALAQGEFESAFGYLSQISPPGVIAPHVPQALWSAMDFVESAVRAGHPREAEAHVTAMCEGSVADISPRMSLLVDAAEAMVSPPGIAEEVFSRALNGQGIDRWPFDRARVLLLYGEHLRRMREITQARSALANALEIFQQLGAEPWAARASGELRASGVVHAGLDVLSAMLTPQEREIALMAASGMTNKEIGQRLYLSHRTVGSHLYRVFPKLGIVSRMGLRDAMSALHPSGTY